MKLALLTPLLSHAAGGLAASVPGMAGGLSARGLEVHVVGTCDRLAPDGWRQWGRVVHPCKQFGPRSFGFSPNLVRSIKDLDFDLVDLQGLWAFPSLAVLSWYRCCKRPYVVTPRGMLDRWALANSAWKKHLAGFLYERRNLAGAFCLHATAAMEAGHFRAYGLKNPIAIVPNGIDLPILTPRPDAAGRKRRLLFLSRLHPKKGIDHLLGAWARLQSNYRDWELVIAGPEEGGHRAAMQRLAAHLGLRDIVWHEPVQGGEKTLLYRSADLFVLPTHAENFGLVVAEALAHEVPVVTTRNAPWEGLEKHRCGWWVDLSDDALVAALDDAMSLSDGERQAKGQRGRVWMARDFTWPAVAQQMHGVYNWVLGGGAPPDCVLTD